MRKEGLLDRFFPFFPLEKTQEIPHFSHDQIPLEWDKNLLNEIGLFLDSKIWIFLSAQLKKVLWFSNYLAIVGLIFLKLKLFDYDDSLLIPEISISHRSLQTLMRFLCVRVVDLQWSIFFEFHNYFLNAMWYNFFWLEFFLLLRVLVNTLLLFPRVSKDNYMYVFFHLFYFFVVREVYYSLFHYRFDSICSHKRYLYFYFAVLVDVEKSFAILLQIFFHVYLGYDLHRYWCFYLK